MDANLGRRVTVGVVAVPPILLLARWGGIPFLLFVGAVVVAGMLEWSALAGSKGARVNLPLALALAAAVGLDCYLRAGADAHVLVVAAVLLVLTWELWRKEQGSALLNSAATLAGVLYVGVLGGVLVLLRQWPPQTDLWPSGSLVILLFVLVWCTDTFAYFIGRWLGRHRLFPRVSPKKTVEGALAGLIGGVAVAWVAGATLLKAPPMRDLLAIAVLVGVCGQIGDLAESLMKRDAGVKDTSGLLPGHGGVLDRFDSLLFAAPVVYLWLRYFC